MTCSDSLTVYEAATVTLDQLNGQFPTTMWSESQLYQTRREYNVLGLKPIKVVKPISETPPPYPGDESTNTNAAPVPISTLSTPTPTTSVSSPLTVDLDSRTKIGIGIGASFGGTLLLALVGILLHHWKWRNNRNTAGIYIQKAQLSVEPSIKEQYITELHDGQVYEMGGITDPVEIDRLSDVPEMEGGSEPVEADQSSNIPEMEAKYGIAELDGDVENSARKLPNTIPFTMAESQV